MGRSKKNLGDFGENVACECLKNEGCKILEQNFYTNVGEIDIIASDNGVIVFVEVKTRSSLKFGMPSEAINRTKREHLYAAAEEYYRQNPTDCEMRFDAVEVIARCIKGDYELISVNHIKDIYVK